MRRFFIALTALLSALPSAAGADPNPFLDLDFEAPECSSGWLSSPYFSPYEQDIDASVSLSGAQSLRVRYASPFTWGPWAYSLMYRELPAAEVAGKRIRLSGSIQTSGLTTGYAALWLTSRNRDGSATDAESYGVTGAATPWTADEFEVDIPANAQSVTIGTVMFGPGTAWFDGLALTVDGRRWHEGPSPLLLQPSPGAADWLRSRAIPFATTQPGSGLADLQALKPLIGDARIVALGEQTHGTREFFQMKHRMLELLATEQGFTHFAMEANPPEAEKINQYVLTGEGNPRELLASLRLWPWQAQEVLDLILWMRDFNASGRGRLQFAGFDSQFSGAASANVRSFLLQAEPEYVPVADSVFAQILAAEERRQFTAADFAAARSVYDHLAGKREEYLSRFSRDEVDRAIQNARVVLQAAGYYTGLLNRDENMADNVDWLLAHAPEGSRVVLWAHNGHVRKRPGWMGHYLAQRHGSEMLVLGFALGGGSYNTIGTNGLTSYAAAPPPVGSVESLLGAAGLPRYVLDLRGLGEDSPAFWFRRPQRFRSGEAVFQRCPFFPAVVADELDALIWIESSTPSTLLQP